ncbi:hypothetical protein GCM10022396_39970 [Flavivirga amylovorans]
MVKVNVMSSIKYVLGLLSILLLSCHQKEEPIRAFCLDVNWKIKSDKKQGDNNFAPLGAWGDLDAQEHVSWCKDLGVNVIQSFAVSSNGYAWYKGGKTVPEQPGLKTDFLTDLVKLGRKENMKVFGYFCIGSNTKWGLDHPELSYETPSKAHIPLTKAYNDYLSASIKEALTITDMDGFMVDWLWNPKGGSVRWLPCEQEMFLELMGEPFPGRENISKATELEFRRKAISRCWKTIHDTAKSVKPECIIWLSCSDLKHPDIVNSDVFKQVDWLQNEAGDKESIDYVKTQIGDHTRLITTFSANFFKRNNLKAEDVAAYALKENIGLYTYVTPKAYDFAFPPVKDYLSKPLDTFEDIDERNIAFLARLFNNMDTK